MRKMRLKRKMPFSQHPQELQKFNQTWVDWVELFRKETITSVWNGSFIKWILLGIYDIDTQYFSKH